MPAPPTSGSPTRVESVAAMRVLRGEYRAAGLRVGLVPTMGYLHDGHLSLVRQARAHADRVVVSIYVNPTQFGPSEDLDRYPRDLDGDLAKLAEAGADAVFLPSDASMYPEGASTWVTVDGLTQGLCGGSRPTHFRGVTTIVTKLFLVVEPHVAVFGQKDYQQLQVIRRMTTDLLLPIEILGGPIVREADGLAMSSRNAYLTPAQRAAAPAIQRALREAAGRYAAGERDGAALRAGIVSAIEAAPELRCDYVELVHARSLAPFDLASPLPETDVHVAAAVFAGTTRLIDNLSLSDPASA